MTNLPLSVLPEGEYHESVPGAYILSGFAVSLIAAYRYPSGVGQILNTGILLLTGLPARGDHGSSPDVEVL